MNTDIRMNIDVDPNKTYFLFVIRIYAVHKMMTDFDLNTYHKFKISISESLTFQLVFVEMSGEG